MALNYPVLDSLISQFEGFGKEGVPATVNNNPGNIIAGSFATAHGATGVNNGFAVFPDPITGAQATDALIGHYDSMGLSVSDLINKWAPGSAPGNTPAGTQSYIDFVSGKLGVPADTPINVAEKKTPENGGSTTGGSSSPSITQRIFQGALDTVAPGMGTLLGSTTSGGTPALSFGRIGAFILGFVFIAGGLYLFKPVQNIVNTGVRGAIEA